MFYSFIRVGEAAALEWSHLRLVWKVGNAERTTLIGSEPAGGVLQSLTIHILESKTDQEGAGQVRVSSDLGQIWDQAVSLNHESRLQT